MGGGGGGGGGHLPQVSDYCLGLCLVATYFAGDVRASQAGCNTGQIGCNTGQIGCNTGQVGSDTDQVGQL